MSKTKPKLSELGFGNYFTDHMFMAEFDVAKGWHSSRIVPYAPLNLDPAAAVFHYGQALFEGLKAYRQKNKIVLFRPHFNAQRLNKGAERLCLPPVPEKLFLSGIMDLIKTDREWVPEAPGSLYIRPTLIGSEGFLGVRPSKKSLFFVILSPVSTYYKEGLNPIRIWIEEELTRAAPGGLGATKAGANYAASLLAAEKAKKAGCAQVLWLDALHRQEVEEVGTMNVFFKFQDRVVTPPLRGTILEGGTRGAAMELVKSWKLPISEEVLTVTQIMDGISKGTLQEVFGTGTAAVISPVGEFVYREQINKIGHGGVGELSKRLYDELTAIQFGTKPDIFSWLVEL